MPVQTTGHYLQPAVMTAPGTYRPLLADLPRGIAALAGVAHGLLIHEHIAGAYGVTLTDQRRASVHVRPVAGLLGRIVYLNAGLGVICAFIGVKLLLRGAGAAAIPAGLSVLVVAAVLLATVLAGMIASRRSPGIAEQAMLERRFAVVDTDGNGIWQRDDGQLLTRRLCEAFGHAPDSATGRALASAQQALFDAMLAHLDANDDAQISRDEFVTGVGRDIADRPGFDAAVGSTARTLIQVADIDGNGVLDAGEYTRLAAAYGARADQARRAFSRLDQDRNGMLDTAELTTAISQFFDSRDPRARGNVAFGHV